MVDKFPSVVLRLSPFPLMPFLPPCVTALYHLYFRFSSCPHLTHCAWGKKVKANGQRLINKLKHEIRLAVTVNQCSGAVTASHPSVSLFLAGMGSQGAASGCLVFGGGQRLAEQIALSRPLHKCSKLHSKYEARPELAATRRPFYRPTLPPVDCS